MKVNPGQQSSDNSKKKHNMQFQSKVKRMSSKIMAKGFKQNLEDLLQSELRQPSSSELKSKNLSSEKKDKKKIQIISNKAYQSKQSSKNNLYNFKNVISTNQELLSETSNRSLQDYLCDDDSSSIDSNFLFKKIQTHACPHNKQQKSNSVDKIILKHLKPKTFAFKDIMIPNRSKSVCLENLQIDNDHACIIVDNLNQRIMNINSNTKQIKMYHLPEDQEIHNDSNESSIGSVDQPFDNSTNFLITSQLDNYFEIEEILINVQEYMSKDNTSEDVKQMLQKKNPIAWRIRKCRKFCKICTRIIITKLRRTRYQIFRCYSRKKRSPSDLWQIVRNHFLTKANERDGMIERKQFRKLIEAKKREIANHQQALEDMKQKLKQNDEDNNDQNKSQSRINNFYANQDITEKQCFIQIKKKISGIYEKLLIHPSNRKLQYFHMIVAICLLADTFLTGVTLSNQAKKVDPSETSTELIDEKSWYLVICLIQTIDIILNFFKIEITPTSKIDKPRLLFYNYISRGFVMDAVAVIPYSLLGPTMGKYIFLRFLKLFEFAKYLSYFTEFVLSFIPSMNNEQSKIFQSLFKLLFQIFTISHMCACLWILIGESQFNNDDEGDIDGRGWIYAMQENQIMKKDYWSKYIAAFYWVITTFSSVGYGDLTGNTKTEYIYTMFVEMLGICFFGYIIGLFQSILQKIGTSSNTQAELEDQVSYWLMLLDKAVSHHKLNDYQIQQGVRQFFANQYKYDPKLIIDSDFFEQLQPKSQNQILDIIFNRFYKKFEIIFRGCGDAFKREIFKNCQFMQFIQIQPKKEKESCFVMNQVYCPCIIQANSMSEGVYFIIQGQVSVMDSKGQFRYTVLQEESLFGEVSLLLDEPNNFGYFYDPYDKPVSVLFISSDDFLKICTRYQGDSMYIKRNAIKRKQQFEFNRTQILGAFIRKFIQYESYFKRICSKQQCEKIRELTIQQFNEGTKLLRLIMIQLSIFKIIKLRKKKITVRKSQTKNNQDRKLESKQEIIKIKLEVLQNRVAKIFMNKEIYEILTAPVPSTQESQFIEHESNIIQESSSLSEQKIASNSKAKSANISRESSQPVLEGHEQPAIQSDTSPKGSPTLVETMQRSKKSSIQEQYSNKSNNIINVEQVKSESHIFAKDVNFTSNPKIEIMKQEFKESQIDQKEKESNYNLPTIMNKQDNQHGQGRQISAQTRQVSSKQEQPAKIMSSQKYSRQPSEKSEKIPQNDQTKIKDENKLIVEDFTDIKPSNQVPQNIIKSKKESMPVLADSFNDNSSSQQQLTNNTKLNQSVQTNKPVDLSLKTCMNITQNDALILPSSCNEEKKIRIDKLYGIKSGNKVPKEVKRAKKLNNFISNHMIIPNRFKGKDKVLNPGNVLFEGGDDDFNHMEPDQQMNFGKNFVINKMNSEQYEEQVKIGSLYQRQISVQSAVLSRSKTGKDSSLRSHYESHESIREIDNDFFAEIQSFLSDDQNTLNIFNKIGGSIKTSIKKYLEVSRQSKQFKEKEKQKKSSYSQIPKRKMSSSESSEQISIKSFKSSLDCIEVTSSNNDVFDQPEEIKIDGLIGQISVLDNLILEYINFHQTSWVVKRKLGGDQFSENEDEKYDGDLEFKSLVKARQEFKDNEKVDMNDSDIDEIVMQENISHVIKYVNEQEDCTEKDIYLNSMYRQMQANQKFQKVQKNSLKKIKTTFDSRIKHFNKQLESVIQRQQEVKKFVNEII